MKIVFYSTNILINNNKLKKNAEMLNCIFNALLNDIITPLIKRIYSLIKVQISNSNFNIA